MFKDRGPRPAYWDNAFYRELVEQRRAILDAPLIRVEEILGQHPYLSLFDGIDVGLKTALRISFFLIFPAIIASFPLGPWPIISVVGVMGLAWPVRYLVQRQSQDRKNKVLSAHSGELKTLSERAEKATREVIVAWEAFNIDFAGYPPDWEERRRAVRKRDNYQCADCGWPNGSLRRSRNLHTHHIVPLSRGGDNSESNLITLCHVCHRKQDGPGHEQVRYTPRKSTNRRLGRRRKA